MQIIVKNTISRLVDWFIKDILDITYSTRLKSLI